MVVDFEADSTQEENGNKVIDRKDDKGRNNYVPDIVDCWIVLKEFVDEIETYPQWPEN